MNKNGFTLIEMMISLGILGIIMLTYVVLTDMQRITLHATIARKTMVTLAQELNQVAADPYALATSIQVECGQNPDSPICSCFRSHTFNPQASGSATTPTNPQASGSASASTWDQICRSQILDPSRPLAFNLFRSIRESSPAAIQAISPQRQLLKQVAGDGTRRAGGAWGAVYYTLRGRPCTRLARDEAGRARQDPTCQIEVRSYIWASCSPSEAIYETSSSGQQAASFIPNQCPLPQSVHIVYQIRHIPEAPEEEMSENFFIGRRLHNLPPDEALCVDSEDNRCPDGGGGFKGLIAFSTDYSSLPQISQKDWSCTGKYRTVVGVRRGNPLCACNPPFSYPEANCQGGECPDQHLNPGPHEEIKPQSLSSDCVLNKPICLKNPVMIGLGKDGRGVECKPYKAMYAKVVRPGENSFSDASNLQDIEKDWKGVFLAGYCGQSGSIKNITLEKCQCIHSQPLNNYNMKAYDCHLSCHSQIECQLEYIDNNYEPFITSPEDIEIFKMKSTGLAAFTTHFHDEPTKKGSACKTAINDGYELCQRECSIYEQNKKSCDKRCKAPNQLSEDCQSCWKKIETEGLSCSACYDRISLSIKNLPECQSLNLNNNPIMQAFETEQLEIESQKEDLQSFKIEKIACDGKTVSSQLKIAMQIDDETKKEEMYKIIFCGPSANLYQTYCNTCEIEPEHQGFCNYIKEEGVCPLD